MTKGRGAAPPGQDMLQHAVVLRPDHRDYGAAIYTKAGITSSVNSRKECSFCSWVNVPQAKEQMT